MGGDFIALSCFQITDHVRRHFPAFDNTESENQALTLSLRQTSHELANILSQMQLPASVVNQLRSMIDDTQPSKLADMVASMIDLTIEEKLSVLDTVEPKERIEKVLKLLARQIQVLKISRKLQSTVEGKLGEKQREYILREQLNAIKQELGEKDEEQDEIEDLNKRINDAQLPPEAGKAATRELKRLKRMHPSMAEYQVVRTYLEWLSELPWNKESADMLDIEKARKVLNDDHYGLDKVKSRILEFLAVRKLKKDLKGPILCLLGPPGVGKTSLGRSIASALDRKFHRIALGGVRDEAEIRGHRRTYIGALPGLVVQGLRRCAVNNPVFLLGGVLYEMASVASVDIIRSLQTKSTSSGATSEETRLRRCSRFWTRNKTTLSRIITSTCRLTFRRFFSSPLQTRSRPFLGRCSIVWRSSGFRATRSRRNCILPVDTCFQNKSADMVSPTTT